MNPKKKFVKAAADMEKALAEALSTVIEKDAARPEQLENLIKLMTKKEIALSLLLEEINKVTFKKGRRKKKFNNNNPIWIDGEEARSTAKPYPSTINVSGVKDNIKKVSVTLHQLSHTWPRDLIILLAGPEKRNLVLMCFAGAGEPLKNVTFNRNKKSGNHFQMVYRI